MAAWAQAQAEAERYAGSAEGQVTRTAAVYYPAAGGEWLVPEAREITFAQEDCVDALLSALCAQPEDSACVVPLASEGALTAGEPSLNVTGAGERVLELNLSEDVFSRAVAAGVEPCLVPKANQLAGVDDVFNAVLVKGDMLGDVVFYGKGAGKLPTASAVVADVVDALKNGSKVHDSLFWQPAEPVEGMLTDPAPAAYYVRAAGIAPAVVEAIYGKGRVVDEHFDGCSYLVEQADAKAMAEAARKVETVGGSVKLVLKKLPEEA